MDAELHLYEVCDTEGHPDYDAVCTGVGEAARNGADIISLSLGRYQSHEEDRARHGGASPGPFDGSTARPERATRRRRQRLKTMPRSALSKNCSRNSVPVSTFVVF